MNKSKSSPSLVDSEKLPNIKKSTSCELLEDDEFYFEEFFEGDGELGIIFATNREGDIVVKNILPRTVASETYGFYASLMLIDVDNTDVTNMPLEKVKKKIQKAWIENSRVYLKFRKPIYKEVYTRLLDNDLVFYYDHFIELGAKSNEDFEFVEYEDLVKMNMSREEIKRFRNINHNI
jgi:hypothetical protein